VTTDQDQRFPVPGQVSITAQAGATPGDLNDTLLNSDFWNDQMLAEAGIPIYDVPFVTIGGGFGSFVLVDYLRIAGVPTSQMRVLSVLDNPWETYEYLTRVSQIPRHERLRSDAASRPDNIWGFPSYAMAEAVRGHLGSAWNVLVEPILADYWTPQAGHVFKETEREAKRINYHEMLVKGLVRMVRRRQGGGYFTILTPAAGTSATKRVAFRSRWVHVSVGYPGLKFLPELQEFRTKSRDYTHVVNAYESHEHVYEKLLAQGGTVVVRGAGIVASRILQRLMDDRIKNGARTEIVHIFRTWVSGTHTPGKPKLDLLNRRRGGDGWQYQGFNWPKSVWGGQHRFELEKIEGQERADRIDQMGGTTTPYRRYWQKQMKQGRKEGWYKPVHAKVTDIEIGADSRIITRIETAQGPFDVASDFIIDCTGLEADITEHRLLDDLLKHGGAARNPKGRLDCSKIFEVRGTECGNGKMYASGSITLGAYFPAVDSFLGMQFSAQRIYEDLAAQKFCKRIRPFRSITQWYKWLFNATP
jgi:hypothetical protein